MDLKWLTRDSEWDAQLPWCPIAIEALESDAKTLICLGNLDPSGSRIVIAAVRAQGIVWQRSLGEVVNDASFEKSHAVLIDYYWISEQHKKAFVDLRDAGVFAVDLGDGTTVAADEALIAKCRPTGLRSLLSLISSEYGRRGEAVSRRLARQEGDNRLQSVIVDWHIRKLARKETDPPLEWSRCVNELVAAAEGASATNSAADISDFLVTVELPSDAIRAIIVGVEEATASRLCQSLAWMGTDGEALVKSWSGARELSNGRRTAIANALDSVAKLRK